METEESAKRYSLEVRFHCTLEQWVDFVFQIESSPSLFGVLRANLSVQEDQPDQLAGYLRLLSEAPEVQIAGVPGGP